MNNLNTTKKNYIYHTLYQVITIITPLITTPYISRVLLSGGIGEYSYYYTNVQYFVIIGNLGFSTYGQIEIAKYQEDRLKRTKIFWEIFYSRFFVFAGTFLFYFIYFLLCQNKMLVIILGLLLLSSAIDICWLFFGMDNFKSVSMRNIYVKLGGIIGIFLFVKTKDDVWIYTLILSLTTLLGSIAMWKKLNHYVDRFSVKECDLKQHYKPAIAFFLPNIATSIYTMADRTMIGMITDSNEQVGIYEEAHKIEQILIQFLLSVSVVYRSQMARLFHENNVDKINDNIQSALKVIFFFSFPMCFGLMAISEELVLGFLGEGFIESIPLLNIFALLLVIISISNSMSNMYLIVTNKQDKFRRGIYIGASVNIIGNIILIPIIGAMGAAISSVIAEVVILVVFYYYSKDYYRFNQCKKMFFTYFFTSILMMLVLVFVKRFLLVDLLLKLVVEILCGCIVYFGVLAIVKDKMIFSMIEYVKKKIGR